MDPAEARAGLCASCRFQRLVVGARSTFSLCERSLTDARFARYPPLPVVQCIGYVRVAMDEAQEGTDPGETK
jgi:hypothetical protein